MPRVPRMVVTDSGQKAAYHVISRTALDGLPFGKVEKDELVRIIQRYSAIYSVEVLGFAIMGNHFHLLVQVSPGDSMSNDEVRRRFHLLYGEGTEFPEGRLDEYRERFSSLSAYVKDIKQRFSCFYNKRKKRKGTLWGERFKSVIVEQGNTLIHCLAYIDLNAVRAGIVKRPEDYRWCSMGYHFQTGNKDGFLSSDLGMPDFGVGDPSTRFRTYREYLYHLGAIDKRGKAKISRKVLDEEAAQGFDMNRLRRFRYRSRYFTDSGIIGSRAFVEAQYETFKDHFQSARVKIPKRVKGIEGMYSLKRLSEA
ncbi:transposase [Desulfoluna spongiiphila]|uniref:REP element-mobilizing transposase RayT n=1 Tax=Desulfoluna spongiiphila TaxID=419481 RepID=A0A1G5BLF3_9BACT|nr:transposase [Desulfoluna spongiiphila]SCX90988.1 REP element-mobilizing transposase RayT [Desulfoluna spongiiphila]